MMNVKIDQNWIGRIVLTVKIHVMNHQDLFWNHWELWWRGWNDEWLIFVLIKVVKIHPLSPPHPFHMAFHQYKSMHSKWFGQG